MHELGLIIDVVEMVERYAAENQIESIKKVVLTVGEGFSVVPHLMQTVYRNAAQGTMLEGSELELNLVDASAKCQDCGGTFNPLRTNGVCSHCDSRKYTVLSGKEFEITSIVV